ncbi:hypothetical protein PHYSODRAFT_338099 [Phytophthora sojae]|uniref:Uncharacterized protein n=1 Tax=Phytophthora sojae (strain P6497) TaxID=1094619 RepID=G5A0Q4_PHYSP|nr:hypothetical protein PHYSODRAFT_338099 [Phytophthora sojae]EGZ11390.1 hypothetical protein PHYSODRAFT_338099 [Phytophthora sojae]|eukprot:XP_009534135.1 hypothetical protein PHYSODRAFT_338099 [Phytophthora sojae]
MYVSIASLDWNQVEQTPRGEVYEVCDADEEGWALFMESEAPETKCGKMEWIDGRIAIVEFPSRERGDLVGAFVRCVTQNISLDAYLHPSVGGSTPRHLPYHEADLSYGPTSQGGGTLPPGIQWRDWDTLKLEIGYSRGWGHGPGATYKLYMVLHRDGHLPLDVSTRVEAPHTVVKLNSRLLLGLAPRARLPRQPPVPVGLFIDLYEILELTRARF